MESLTLSNQLPREILQCIFQHINPLDRKTCTTVCKLWNSMVEVIYRFNIKVSISPINCFTLLQDTIRYKDFGPKILCMTFDNEVAPVNRHVFIKLLEACTNLNHLKFTAQDHLYEYLYVVYSNIATLPKIQRINAMHMASADYAMLRVYNNVRSAYQDKWTSLSVWHLGIQEELGAIGILEKATTKMPQLKHLKVKIGKIYLVNEVIYINLPQLIEINKNLETLKIIYYRTAVPMDREVCLNPSRTLRDLKLTASRVDLYCLDYIRNELPALEKLVFKCHRLTGEIPKSTTIQELFGRFNFYCDRFRSVVVDLKYEDVSLEFYWETEDFNTEESDTDDEVDEDGPRTRWRRN